jgi:hypothetical protein
MWMKGQQGTVPQFLTHCLFDRQRNPCNYMEMEFTGEGRKAGNGKAEGLRAKQDGDRRL